MDAGMNGHIAKPIDMKLVIKEIRRIKEGKSMNMKKTICMFLPATMGLGMASACTSESRSAMQGVSARSGYFDQLPHYHCRRLRQFRSAGNRI